MSATVKYRMNAASTADVERHLLRCDEDFVPPLSTRVNISAYARKLATRATRFEAWCDGTLVGLVAAYCNDADSKSAYITSVSVLREWTRRGIAATLLQQCIAHAEASGMSQIRLEVARQNAGAIRLYEKDGFVPSRDNAEFVAMNLYFKGRPAHEKHT